MGAFADRVSRRFKIADTELDFLLSLEARPTSYPRGHIIANAGDPAEHAYVLLSGWAMSYTCFPNGAHQVRRLHFPGDLMAMPSIPMCHHAEDIETVSRASIATFPKRELAGLFQHPRLAAIMYMFAQAERITSGDRIASIGGKPANARIAFLLMDMLHRMRSADPAVECSFELYLTRTQMAHVTGITPVHASRTWSVLRKQGLFTCEGTILTILEEEQLTELSGYSVRDSDFDYGWLAAVEQEG